MVRLPKKYVEYTIETKLYIPIGVKPGKELDRALSGIEKITNTYPTIVCSDLVRDIPETGF